jgi:hypothetical protein
MSSVRILVRTHTDINTQSHRSREGWRRRMRTESIKALLPTLDKILRLIDG